MTRPILISYPVSILYNKFNIHNGLNTILEMIYPIGSIYTSMNSTNPADVFGFGTWQQITDRFLYCANSDYWQGKYWYGNKNRWNEGYTSNGSGTHSHNVSGYTQTTGKGTDYMPPYMTVYAWFRVQ
ncbi:hypothetical protein TVAG_575350 [Trichomonas vaginalis G3]|uniref:Baseplate structural protein Gp10 C-terminal domain-containing protein n=1 Tax=Trichomonas vaginalis (strain ATCC PRA-98 / G3) TaxID=412133 RepID=A2HIF5_TRIV3|nr:keratin-associated protein family [Trichomonas vaginalis G3]EAX70812.1 hypothetical protein TVAG_575350 [Trichomonas vaginalis G3]KAI5494108.1 keratin-associated protein family [Trichomonas vaginalis G3]|eukprot:XP_001283742.1 hypothetical protein [Trichomonas vaginalis G3]